MTTPPDDLTARARAIGLSRDHWPYGAYADKVRRDVLYWAESNHVRYSPNGGWCLHWLTRGRCAVQVCRENRNKYGWMDHTTGWTRGGKPAAMIFQPYHLTDEGRAQLDSLAATHGLDIHIGDTGWYGHGTIFIELWKQAREA